MSKFSVVNKVPESLHHASTQSSILRLKERKHLIFPLHPVELQVFEHCKNSIELESSNVCEGVNPLLSSSFSEFHILL